MQMKSTSRCMLMQKLQVQLQVQVQVQLQVQEVQVQVQRCNIAEEVQLQSEVTAGVDMQRCRG